MDTELYSSKTLQDQASFNSALDYSPVDLIEKYRTSPRGDFRVIAALLTIERERAEIISEAAPVPSVPVPSVPPPAINICAYADDSLPPDFEASATVLTYVAADAIAAARRGKAIIKAMRKASRTKERRKPPRPISNSSATPIKRLARARAVHSHLAHGGARNRDSGSAGNGESTPGTAPTRLYIREALS